MEEQRDRYKHKGCEKNDTSSSKFAQLREKVCFMCIDVF